MTDSPDKRVRLTHVVVQAHFVVDDGDKLTRKQVNAVELELDEVGDFFDTKLPQALAKFEAELNGGSDA